ncbi:MAG: cbb3-type cytochrome c oxidase N-terminal domain-containing protein [Planctomycetota bacterium]|nr:cbb3-type cytochrome c oxidase N-terminal domain-containing protein [Planctomycetota bacterium]
MSNNDDKLMHHEYDGIQEYDNPTPGWWHLIFLGSVVFSIFYFTFFEFSSVAWSVHDVWKANQTREFKRIFGQVGNLEGDEGTLLKVMNDPKLMAVAEGIFVGNCAACHSKDGGAGGGMTGVNLTDDHYKNVSVLTDVLNVINKGANNGAMPSWENRLSKNERIIVAAYAASLRGKASPNGKGPEGKLIDPWPNVAVPGGGPSGGSGS